MRTTQMADLLTVQQVAAIVRVQPETIRSWIRRGEVAAIHLPSGTYRLTRDEVDRLLGQTTGGRS